jgi:hypothetical protein
MTDKCLRCGHVMDDYEKDCDYCLPCFDTLTKSLGRKPTKEDYLYGKTNRERERRI